MMSSGKIHFSLLAAQSTPSSSVTNVSTFTVTDTVPLESGHALNLHFEGQQF
jgi:hypothetical protein